MGVAGEHKELSVTEILQALGKDPMWMWVDVNGTPITNSVPDTIRERRLKKYLADRDGYRASKGKPPIWVGTKPAFASLQFKLDKSHRGTWDEGSRSSGTRDGMAATLVSQTRRNWKTHCVYYVDSLTDKDTGFWSVSMWRVWQLEMGLKETH